MSARSAATGSPNDYLASLESAWAEHLAPRAPDAPTVISTFAGGGGSSLGYSMAGYRELLAVEWDDNAAATFRLNFPDVPLYHGDITKLSVEDCLRLAGIKLGELDVFDGSPPCQGFSTAGKRQIDDPRNSLFRDYVRLLRGIQPRAFVMENVSGMVKGKMKLVFAECLRELRASGYRVRARLLNAMYFGVPQSRQRMIFIGVRNDLGIEPSYPSPTCVPISAALVICDIVAHQTTTYEEAIRLQKYEVGKWIQRCRPGEQASKYHPRGSFFNAARIHISRPCQTIPKTGGYSEASLCHHTETRYLVREELMRLSSFPDRYRFVGTLQNSYNRIGNSVPPLFMRAIARHVAGLIRPAIIDTTPTPELSI
jgi:DNA (cytosine-5)-methyltransferase 1